MVLIGLISVRISLNATVMYTWNTSECSLISIWMVYRICLKITQTVRIMTFFEWGFSRLVPLCNQYTIWAPSSEFVPSSIPSWQILTAHAQPFRGARDLAFCLKVPLDSLLVWASSEGSDETAPMRRLAWTFAARIGDKYQIRLTRSIYMFCCNEHELIKLSMKSGCYLSNSTFAWARETFKSNVIQKPIIHKYPTPPVRPKYWVWPVLRIQNSFFYQIYDVDNN